MRTSEERAAGPHRRMDAMKRAKARRRYVLACTAAISACLAVTVLLSPAGSRLPARAQNAASGGMTASIFTGTPAPGYFVAAVLAFILGILVTVLCFRLRRHMEDRHDDRTD